MKTAKTVPVGTGIVKLVVSVEASATTETAAPIGMTPVFVDAVTEPEKVTTLPDIEPANVNSTEVKKPVTKNEPLPVSEEVVPVAVTRSKIKQPKPPGKNPWHWFEVP